MIKTIKHIISLFAITSVLALSFMGCKQPTTPEVKDTVAPAEVSDLKAVTGDTKVTLSWKNPTDEDFFNVIITYDGKTKQTQVGGANSIDITELVNGKAYTFEVQTVDDKQNKSSGVTVSQYPMNPLTETPTKVSSQTINIVKFGDWPQSLKTNSVKLSDNTTKVNNWDCYYGSDGAYYVKATAAPYENTYTFDDGKTKIEQGKEYYFKLEPIQWRVLTDNYSGKKLLFAEKALATSCFYTNEKNRGTKPSIIYPNNYEKSEIRAYLNGLDGSSYSVTNFNNNGFLQKAFTKAAIEQIADTLVDNSADSTTDAGNKLPKETKHVCGNTTDKIFLLSEKEITTADYGFDVYNKYVGDPYETQTSTRTRKTTDYARATGAASYAYDKDNPTLANCSAYSLRSPCSFEYTDKDIYARIIDGNAHADNIGDVTNSSLSVVPALTITSYEKQ